MAWFKNKHAEKLMENICFESFGEGGCCHWCPGKKRLEFLEGHAQKEYDDYVTFLLEHYTAEWVIEALLMDEDSRGIMASENVRRLKALWDKKTKLKTKGL